MRLWVVVMISLSLLLSSAAYANAEAGPELILENGAKLPVGYIDRDRQPDQIGIYTYRYGETTPPFDSDSVEFIVTGDVFVEKNTDGTAGTRIPANSYVISAPGGALAELHGLAVGQTVKVLNVSIEVRPEKYAAVKGITVKIDKLNATRGLGEVILFDPTFGPSTKQNAYGMEITVEGGKATRVVALTADPNIRNDSPIPPGGYVVSIQNKSPYYIQLNGKVKAGDPVDIVLDPLQYRISKISYDGIDANVRGANQLIVYSRSYGERTGTNPYGNEVAVNGDGMAITSGGNNRVIPVNGYVLSGVGTKGDWLKENVPVGSKIRIDTKNRQVIAIFTPQSYLEKANYYFTNLREELQRSKNEFRDIPYAQIEQQITVGESVYGQIVSLKRANGPVQQLSSLYKQLDGTITDADLMREESRVMETRGVWLRPKETTREQVRQNMLKIKAANFNTVFLETWWDGRTIYPTTIADAAQNPIYGGFDVLQAYIEEAKSLGIEIHAWVENFRGGDVVPGPALTAHPGWGIMSRLGHSYEVAGTVKKYYLNPALPEVRNYLSALYNEILTKYDIAGLHLDFTRYPHSHDFSNDFGYDPYTRDQFRQIHGADPSTLRPEDALWDVWLRFRTGIINNWVDRVVTEVRAVKPEIQISAAVWTNYDTAPALMGQEVKTWTGKNQIDQIVPMSYYRDATPLVGDLRKSFEIADGKASVASGIGAFMNVQGTMIAEQIREVNRAGGAGTAMFEFESTFANGYDRVLSLGAYRSEAVRPDYRKTKPLAALLRDMIRKIDDIYVPLNGLSVEKAEKYKKQLRVAIVVLDTRDTFIFGTANAAKQHLDSLRIQVSQDPTVHREVKNRMTADLEYGIDSLKLYINKSGR